jgi:hypothetical protein
LAVLEKKSQETLIILQKEQKHKTHKNQTSRLKKIGRFKREMQGIELS